MKVSKSLFDELEDKYLHPLAKHSKNAKRWRDKAEDKYCSAYRQDVSTILYSDAFRRLRMKTQVFVASGQDQHNRTRLTHSLEVADIAEILARAMGLNTDIVRAIALAHDLGHAPFGHAGERALHDCLQEQFNLSFYHNVQSVHILRTKQGFVDKEGRQHIGFNLTHEVVEGVWKHTDFLGTVDNLDDSWSYYHPLDQAFLEGQLVAIADRIAYVKHDMDDGDRTGLYTYQNLSEEWEDLTGSSFRKDLWFNLFIDDLITTFLENASSVENNIIIDFSDKVGGIFKTIKNNVKEKVLKSEEIGEYDKAGYEVIKAIFHYYINAPDKLSDKTAANKRLIETGHLDQAVVDYVQWLGDENAKKEYESITGNAYGKNYDLKALINLYKARNGDWRE